MRGLPQNEYFLLIHVIVLVFCGLKVCFSSWVAADGICRFLRSQLASSCVGKQFVGHDVRTGTCDLLWQEAHRPFGHSDLGFFRFL